MTYCIFPILYLSVMSVYPLKYDTSCTRIKDVAFLNIWCATNIGSYIGWLSARPYIRKFVAELRRWSRSSANHLLIGGLAV